MAVKRVLLTCLAMAIGSAGGGISAQTAITTRMTTSGPTTRTPIKHLVVIFDENRPFDHYFGTYPLARNLPGESPFHALPFTPRVENYLRHPLLLIDNPNYYIDPATNQKVFVNPFRLGPH